VWSRVIKPTQDHEIQISGTPIECTAARWQCLLGLTYTYLLCIFTANIMHIKAYTSSPEFFQESHLLSPSALLECNSAIGSMSICPSHTGNASKLMNLGSAVFTDGSRWTLAFQDQLSYPKLQGFLTLTKVTMEICTWKNTCKHVWIRLQKQSKSY